MAGAFSRLVWTMSEYNPGLRDGQPEAYQFRPAADVDF
jgi:hypothetical protein